MYYSKIIQEHFSVGNWINFIPSSALKSDFNDKIYEQNHFFRVIARASSVCHPYVCLLLDHQNQCFFFNIYQHTIRNLTS